MSQLLTAHEAASHLVSQLGGLFAPTPNPGSGGILDWLEAKNTALQGVIKAVSVTIAIGFVVYTAVVSRGAPGRVIVAALVAGLFVWIVYNVPALQSRVETEINSMPGHAAVGQPWWST